MREYTLSEQYAIIGLNGLDSRHMTTARRKVLSALAASKLLEDILSGEMPSHLTQIRLKEGMRLVQKQKKKEAEELEEKTVKALEEDGVLQKIPGLQAGEDSDVRAEEGRIYLSNKEIYAGILERLRAEIWEQGPMTQESCCLLWLLEHSGCSRNIFSGEEQREMERCIVDMETSDEFVRMLWQTE